MYKLIIFLVFLWSGFNTPAFAVPASEQSLLESVQQQLVAEETRSHLLAKKLENLTKEQKSLYAQPITQKLLDRLDLMIKIAKADLDNINVALDTIHQSTALLLDAMRISNSSVQQVNGQQSIQEGKALFNLQQLRTKILELSRQTIQKMLLFTEKWKQDLQRKYQLQAEAKSEQSLDSLVARLRAEQKQWIARLTQWNKELKKANAEVFLHDRAYSQIEFNIFEAQEKSSLLEMEINVVKIIYKLQELERHVNQDLHISALSYFQNKIKAISEQTLFSTKLLQKKIKLLQTYIGLDMQNVDEPEVSVVQDKPQRAILQSILAAYETLLIKTNQLHTHIRVQQSLVDQQLKLQLANRQGLPGWSLVAWLTLGKTISQIPTLTFEKLASLYEPTVNKIEHVSSGQWLLSVVGMLLWFVLWLKLRRFLAVDRVRLQQRSRGFFSAQTVIVVLQLLQRHLTGIMLLSGLIGLLFILGIPFKLFSLVVSISAVSLGFSIVIQLAHIFLLENTTDDSGHDVKLYYRLRTTLLIGGIITFATILVNQLPVNYEVQDLFGRLFMLFLLIVALVLMKGWEVVPTLLEPYIQNKHAYLKQIIRWLSFLIPFSLLTNALIGLVGYVELAWAIAHYQGLFLIALTVYLLIRGLLDELIRWASEQCIRRFRNGWLWSQSLLKPFHQILKLTLLVLSIMGLFELYGRGDRIPSINIKVSKLLNSKLFDITNNVGVTGLTIVELAVLVIVLLWIAHWSREFAYRWLFVQTKDLGLRNSLSIFTQYTLIAIGITMGLNILGLTWANISLIFGLFSFGVGLGLRDLFNNFFTGIFLLLERPVKVGDWVTIGSFDGQVAHIGARSVTVTTHDRQELLVPNADIFSKHFINWTHRDSVVRSLVKVKSNRSDNPNFVREIILEVLAAVPKILTNPKPEVYFEEIDKVLLEFSVEYFVDLNHISSRAGVRSQFLFNLWERFSQEGILPPKASQNVHVAGKIDLQPPHPSE